MQKVSNFVVGSFDNVVHYKQDLKIDLSLFRTVNRDTVSGLDYRRVTQDFLNRVKKKGLLPQVGSLVDLGGTNVPIIDALSGELAKVPLTTLVISKNPLIPALRSFEPQVNFALEDPLHYLSTEHYSDFVTSIKKQGATLFLCNHELRHLTAEEGWAYLDAVWSKLRPGDFLFLSGLDAHSLECFGMERRKEVNGITEFYSEDKLFASAFSKDFIKHLGNRHGKIPIAVKELNEATWTISDDNLYAIHETQITSFNSFFLLRKGAKLPTHS